MPIKYYDGSSWVTLAESDVKNYGGGSWGAVTDASYYDGSRWVSLFGPAPSVTVVDNFEDGDLSEYSGSTGDFAVNTNAPVYNGSYSLKQSSNTSLITSSSGLNAYPSNGDTYSVQSQTTTDSTSGSDLNQDIPFLVQDTNNFYMTRFDLYGTASLDIYEKASGSFTQIATVQPSEATIGEWYRHEITLGTDDSVTFEVFNNSGTSIGSVSASSNDFTNVYSSGGIGWRGAVNVVQDYARIL